MNSLGQGAGQVLPSRPARIEDPRSPLGKLRRRQLYTYADHFGVSYEPGEGAESVRQKLQLKGIRGTELGPDPQPKQLQVDDPEQPDFEHMAMPELRKLVKARGLKQTIRDSKPELIRKLTDGEDTAERRE